MINGVHHVSIATTDLERMLGSIEEVGIAEGNVLSPELDLLPYVF